MSSFRLVSAPDDIARVATLADEIWREHFPSVITVAQIDYMLSRYQSAEAITEQISSGQLTYHLVVDEDGAQGYYAHRAADDGVFLSKLYLRKARRGRGLARAILERLASLAQELPDARVWLGCNKHNEIALAAYARLGFVIVKPIVTDIGGGFVMDDYILEKRL